MPQATSLPIIVLGPQRSGTSALAELLHVDCGVCMGHDFHDPSPNNPRGFYEDLPIQRLNIGVSRGKITRLRYVLKMRDEAAERAVCGLWGFKDPMACTILPLLLEALPDATIIRTSRPTPDIVASWERVYKTDEHQAKAAIEKAERMLDMWAPDAITVTTQQMSQDRIGVVRRMLDLIAQIRKGDYLCQKGRQPISLDDSRA